MQSKAMADSASNIFEVSEDASPEDKLEAREWLRIIERATAGLNADIDAAKSPDPLFPAGDVPALRLEPQNSRQELLPAVASHKESGVAQLSKIAYSFVEPRQAPPQTLQAALMPYAVAAGLCVFVSGAVLAYFAAGSSSADVKRASEAAAPEALAAAGRPDLRGARKGDFQKTQAQPAPAVPSLFSNVAAGPESAAKPGADEAQPAALATWLETVETFRQFVKADAQKSAKAESAR